MEVESGCNMADGQVREQRVRLELLQNVIAKVLRIDYIEHTDWITSQRADRVNIGDLFLGFCRESGDDNITPFARLFEQRLVGN